MKPTDLKCRPQVASVIGEAYADHELQRVIDCDGCQEIPSFDIKNKNLWYAFLWRKSPQEHDFWGCIDRGQNPYQHGHPKPVFKEWEFIDGEWMYKNDDLHVLSDGSCLYVDAHAEPIAQEYCVDMPDYVPETESADKAFGIDGAYDDVPKGIDFGPEVSQKLRDAFKLAEDMGFSTQENKYKVKCKGVEIDVYDVLMAYGVTNPADQHAIKKMLMPGKRGIKDANQDRSEAIQSLQRAIELAQPAE